MQSPVTAPASIQFRRPFCCASAFACVAALTSVAPDAQALDGGPTAPEEGPEGGAPRLMAIDAAIGGGVQSTKTDWPGTMLLGATFLIRPEWFTGGAAAEMQGEPFGPSQQFLGLLGGTTFDVGPSFRIDALAQFGVHLEQPSTGLELFDEEEIVGGDTSFAMPYAGLRLSPAYLIGDERGSRFVIGLWLDGKQDLTHETATYTVQSCGSNWFSGEYSCSMRDESYVAGGAHLTAGIRVGTEFGQTAP